MPARRGSFGSGINPFGSTQGSGLGQYSVASSLAELDLYKTQIEWQNGLASDAAYVASLTKALGATTADSKDGITAQNRLDDAVYTIGRQKAQDQGLDQLIAFDQASLVKMRSDNNHADDIKNALSNELAQKRSKDYGALVDKVNAGKLSTQALLDWIDGTAKTLPADAPDKDNWAQARDSVAGQVQNEKDSKVYQDYQNQRMSGKDFLSYVQSRRDQFSADSPNYADWQRKFEDASNNVKDTELSKQDTAFFDAYNEGHKSSADYLGYIQTRLAGMDSSDPQYETWRHRFTTESFSVAEDQLRFDVNQGKRPVSALVQFYTAYANTLNPGSAEWRTVQSNLSSLSGYGGGSGGSGGSGEALNALNPDKVINNTYTLDTVLHDLAINPNADKADRLAADAMFSANYDNLSRAHTDGDKVWLFMAPDHPDAVIQGKNPDGSLQTNADGSPYMVRGSAYLPVTDEALGNLNTLNAQYHAQLAYIALDGGDSKEFYAETKLSNDALAKNRTLGLQVYQKQNDLLYQNAQTVAGQMLKTGDTAGAYGATMQAILQIQDDLTDPTMNSTRRQSLEALADKLALQPWMPQVDDATGQQTGGALYLNSDGSLAVGFNGEPIIAPGWHFMLADGTSAHKTNGWYQETGVQAGVQDLWDSSHITVTETVDGKTVTGDVEVHDGVRSPKLAAYVNGVWQILNHAGKVSEVQYKDGSGNLVYAYSIDGSNWISSDNGQLPQLQLAGEYTMDPTGVLRTKDGTLAGGVDPATGQFKFDSSFDVPYNWYADDSGSLGGPGLKFNSVALSTTGNLDVRSYSERWVESRDASAPYPVKPPIPSPIVGGNRPGVNSSELIGSATSPLPGTQPTTITSARRTTERVLAPTAPAPKPTLGSVVGPSGRSLVPPVLPVVPPPVSITSERRKTERVALPTPLPAPAPILAPPPIPSPIVGGNRPGVPLPTPPKIVAPITRSTDQTVRRGGAGLLG